jgi:sugar lactone lactonase YvrE
MLSPAGVVTTFAGTVLKLAAAPGSADGSATNAMFNFPVALALDSSTNLYVADTANSTVRMITPAGVVTTLAGTAGSIGSLDGQSANSQFAFPQGIAVSGSGALYVADSGNNTIRIISPGGAVTTLAGQPGKRGGTEGVGTNSLFYHPQGLALDATGNLYVTDALNDSIRVVGTNGAARLLAGPGGSAGSDSGTGPAARFNYPAGVASDAADNLYVADLLNFVVRKITPDGSVSVLAGQPGQSGAADGPGTNALFAGPCGVVVDATGNIYVADTGNETIRVIATNGVVCTLAGLANQGGSQDGTGTNASFSRMSGIAVDLAGNVYAADTGNETIRQVTPGGVVTTLAGDPDTAGSADGLGAAALFSLPTGIAATPFGDFIVADALNNTIRLGLLTPLVRISAGGGGVTVAWPGPLTGFTLETSVSLLPGSAWSAVTNGFSATGGRNVMTNQSGDPIQFYRLRGL